jgi:hypothetical protein
MSADPIPNILDSQFTVSVDVSKTHDHTSVRMYDQRIYSQRKTIKVEYECFSRKKGMDRRTRRYIRRASKQLSIRMKYMSVFIAIKVKPKRKRSGSKSNLLQK